SGTVALSLLASALVAGVVRRATSTLAAAVLLIGLGGSLLVAARFFGAEHAVPWFALLAFTGTLLLGQWGGLATAIAATALLAALPMLGLPATSASVRDAQLLVWAAFALSSLTTWSLRTALDWSW